MHDDKTQGENSRWVDITKTENFWENCPNTSQNKKIAPWNHTETQIPPSTSPHVNNSVVYFTKLINLLLYFTKQFSLLLYLTNSLSVFSSVSQIKIDCYFTSRNVSCCWSFHQRLFLDILSFSCHNSLCSEKHFDSVIII